MKYGPDFICIGAQKSGTSWLYENLRLHPEATMPPEKEINYFVPLPSSPRSRKLLDSRQPADIAWYNQFLSSTRTMENYLKLFPKDNDKVSGDISPAYIALTEHEIESISRALPPYTKIIYLLRNPIDRAWSAFRMDHKLSFITTKATILKKIQIQDGKNVCEHGQYSKYLDRWEKYFPGRVKVWFYDQLSKDPEQLFMEICRYLEISPDVHLNHGKSREKVFEGKAYSMPDNVREYLKYKLKDEIIALHKRFDNTFTESWLKSLAL